MKNLFRLAAAQVSCLSPPVIATLRAQEGYETQPDGTIVPRAIDILLRIMVQPASSADLTQSAGLNQSTDTRVVYLPADLKGIDRTHQFGGDVLVFEGSEWLVTGQPETWGGGQWSKLLVTRQCPSACPP